MSVASVQFVEMAREANRPVKKKILCFCVRCQRKTRHLFIGKEGRWDMHRCEICGQQMRERELISHV